MEKSKSIEGLRIALQTELNGIEFYRIAAEKTADEKGKRVFKMLANDEIKHYKALQKEYSSLLDNEEWQKIELGKISAYDGESPIFSAELKKRAGEMHFEVSALSIGALLESNSIDFYRKMKEISDDPSARALYQQLQHWEENHLEAITRQLELLKEDYWAEQRFSPLL
ncbi:MAG: ferritin family protein [candidate division WOR-3 bacterium]|nr:MAG: ferritin family protein [candidate division WOR-3 bacterium]